MNAKRAMTVLLLGAAGVALGGCKVMGDIAGSYLDSTLKVVHPAYGGLDNKRVAVLVDVDMATQYEHPELALTIAGDVSKRLQENVSGIQVLPTSEVAEWQFRNPQWSAQPYSEVADTLKVDRLVHIDISEFRLRPPGNQGLWEGVCRANVGVVERDGTDPDNYSDQFTVKASYPDVTGITHESANETQVQASLLALFVRRTAWLFYRHLEPRYPDRYKGQIDESRYGG